MTHAVDAPSVTSDGERHPQDLARLTSLRWYAALIVYLFHLIVMFPWRPLRLFTFGSTGVAFFFVLSGFVLTWSMRPGGRARDFYVRRFARIYPSMLVVLLGCVLASWLFSYLNFRTGPLGLVTNVFAVQAWFPGGYPVYAYNGPAWSLSAEAFFYAMFPLIVVPLARSAARRQWTIALLGVAVAAIVAVTLSKHGHGTDLAYNNPVIRSAEFVLGMVLALQVRAGWRIRFPMWGAVLIIAAAALLSRKAPDFPLDNYLMVFPFALLIVLAAQSDIAGKSGILTHPVSVYLGKLSFCFYLVHQVISGSVIRELNWGHQWSTIGGIVPLVVSFLITMVGAMVLHHGVEVPCNEWTKRRFVSSSRRTAIEPTESAFAPLAP